MKLTVHLGVKISKKNLALTQNVPLTDTPSKNLCDDESSVELGETDSYTNDDDNISEDEAEQLSFEVNPELLQDYSKSDN